MSFKIKPPKNNPNPIEFKKESQHEHSEDEIEILEQKTRGQYNNKQIEFKREPINNNHFASSTCGYSILKERIKQLESENKSLIFKINDLNKTIKEQSNEINGLKLRLNKYESESNNHMPIPQFGIDSGQNENETTSDNNQSGETMFNLEIESNHLMSTSESDESDQCDNETNNKVINIISSLDI